MAVRRMLSRQVIESGEFEDISPLAQLLYMRMVLNADDDGFVEARPCMRAISASDAEIDELIAEGFLTKVPDKKRLYHVCAWRTHNTVDPTKYRRSEYFPLLREMYSGGDFLRVLPAWERREIEQEWS